MSAIRRTALIAGAAAVLLFATTSIAAADSSRCTTDASCAGRVTFASYGEVFTVYDQVGDGHSAVALYWLPDGSGPHLIWNPNGNGTSVTANLEFPEGSWVTYRACLGEYGPRQVLTATCGATITDYA